MLGSRWWATDMVPWPQAVAVIPGYSCMVLHFISYFNHYHPKRMKWRLLCCLLLLRGHSQPGPFRLSLTTRSWSEVRRPGAARVLPLRSSKEKEGNCTLIFHCSAFFREVSTAQCARGPAPAFPDAWAVLTSHFAQITQEGAAPLILLSLICPSTPKLGASWLVDNVVLVQGRALIFVSKCCIQPCYLQ